MKEDICHILWAAIAYSGDDGWVDDSTKRQYSRWIDNYARFITDGGKRRVHPVTLLQIAENEIERAPHQPSRVDEALQMPVEDDSDSERKILRKEDLMLHLTQLPVSCINKTTRCCVVLPFFTDVQRKLNYDLEIFQHFTQFQERLNEVKATGIKLEQRHGSIVITGKAQYGTIRAGEDYRFVVQQYKKKGMCTSSVITVPGFD